MSKKKNVSSPTWGPCLNRKMSMVFAACPPGCKKYGLCDDKTEKGLWVYVKYFQLGAVEIAKEVEDRFLRALTLMEEAAKEQLLQEAQVLRKTTEAQVK